MAYKIVNKTQLDYDLKRLGDAIRSKNGTSGNLIFPNGMSDTIRGWSIQNSYYDASHLPSLSPDTANYVLVDGDDLDNKITTVCDAFRAIYGNSSMKIQFPDELIRRIECLDVTRPSISSGKYYITGTYLSGCEFDQAIEGEIIVKDASSGTTYYEGPFTRLVLSDDSMTLSIYNGSTLVKQLYQSSWSWGSTGIKATISSTQYVSSTFKQWWDAHTTWAGSASSGSGSSIDDPIDINISLSSGGSGGSTGIEIYGTQTEPTWLRVSVDSSAIVTLYTNDSITDPELVLYESKEDADRGYIADQDVSNGSHAAYNLSYTMYPGNTYYVKAYNYYDGSPHTLYWSARDPNSLTFTIDDVSYTVDSGTTIQQWLNSGNAPWYYVPNNGYLYNSSAGWYVVKDPYELISVNEVIYSGDVYTSREAPATTITFYFDGGAYECKEGQTWRQMIADYGDYTNTWGHVEITSDGYIKMEGSSNDYIISSDNLNNHYMYLEHADNVINPTYYNWVAAIKLSSSDVYEAYNMQYTSTVDQDWYVPYADISVYYSEPGENQSPQWFGLSSPYIYMNTSGTQRPHRDNATGYDMTPRSDYGVTIHASSCPHTFWFRESGEYYTTSGNTVYPAGKIKCGGYFPVAFVDWLENNFQKE